MRYKIALFPRLSILPVCVQFLPPYLILESLLYYQHTVIIVVMTIVLFVRGSLIYNFGCASYFRDRYDVKQKECPLRKSLNQDIDFFFRENSHTQSRCVNFGGIEHVCFFIYLPVLATISAVSC